MGLPAETTSPRSGPPIWTTAFSRGAMAPALGLAMITDYALRGDTIDTELLYWVVLPT